MAGTDRYIITLVVKGLLTGHDFFELNLNYFATTWMRPINIGTLVEKG